MGEMDLRGVWMVLVAHDTLQQPLSPELQKALQERFEALECSHGCDGESVTGGAIQALFRSLNASVGEFLGR